MKVFNNPTKRNLDAILKRPTQDITAIEPTVLKVFDEVSKEGDVAVKKYTQIFDKTSITQLKVSEAELSYAKANVSKPLQDAIALAKQNITTFHAAQQTSKEPIKTSNGVLCWQEKRPIEKVGIYIPGGTAPLFSTILMLVIPAQLAGCDEIVLCTPPQKDGTIHPAILYTAALCGVTSVYKVGGIQAIAAMTFGTPTIPKVYKIFGPGNQYVTVAKQLATKYGVAIDMPAGPSELLVFADETANASYIASDLLSQAEHGEDSQVILVTTSQVLVSQVKKALALQLEDLPRKAIASIALENSKIIIIDSTKAAINVINQYAPEHFILVSEEEDYILKNLKNAGSVFIGNYTPESAGDYASGTNHTLPTNGYAKQYSGVNLDSFLKSITFQKITQQGLQNIGPSIEVMAAAEGLQAHKNAVTVRLNSIIADKTKKQ